MSWWQEKVFEMVRSSGVQTTEEHYEERRKRCEGCPYFGQVEVKELRIKADGCTVCGCPIETKGRMIKHKSAKEAFTHPFEPSKWLVETKCAGEEKGLNDAGRWSDIDAKYIKNHLPIAA